MSFAVQYDLRNHQDLLTQDFYHMKIESTTDDQPVLYVAMASWIPKCNMYNCDEEMNIPDNQQQEHKEINKSNEKIEEVLPVCHDSTTDDDDDDDDREINDSITSSGTDKNDSLRKPTTPRSQKALEERKRERNERKLQQQREREKQRQEKEREKQEKLEQKRKEREEKEEQKRKEREEKEEQKRKEREEKEEQKRKEREEKEEQKRKERKEKEEKDELKRKEREEKIQKRKEKEEREMQKRKEREQEKLRKQQELDEKNREKQKLEEQKQKAAAAFVNFFVPKKTETNNDEKKFDNSTIFMPFEIKSDMRLPPIRRPQLTQEEKENLEKFLENPINNNKSYLLDLKNGSKSIGKSLRTWPYEDDLSNDCYIVDDDFGESICEDKRKNKKMRVKFLKFHENRRPPYYGTWRKKTTTITPRKPFVEDKQYFDYENDSDEEWEDEEAEQGESLNGSDNEDKDNENENENDDYEVDNEFFVPHGHLSDDEIDDEINSKLSPTALKEKLKLLKDEFEEDMRTQTQKIKPRSIGCIWYNRNGDNVTETIDRYLSPFGMLTNGRIIIKPRQIAITMMKTPKKSQREMKEELIPVFLKFIDLNPNKKKKIIDDFIVYMQNNQHNDELPKSVIEKYLKMFAEWKKCTDKGPMFNKYVWCVYEDVKQKYESK